ncbi:MAG: hypothetical protein IPG54_14095 [Sphingomonadales bacterium]|nr:hypothetical protein [Sphingomonadales bacterium]
MVTQLSIADVEQMQSDVKMENGRVAPVIEVERRPAEPVSLAMPYTIQAIIGHAKHIAGALTNHPTQGAKNWPARSEPGD